LIDLPTRTKRCSSTCPASTCSSVISETRRRSTARNTVWTRNSPHNNDCGNLNVSVSTHSRNRYLDIGSKDFHLQLFLFSCAVFTEACMAKKDLRSPKISSVSADSRQRQILDCLRSGEWRSIHRLPVPVGAKSLEKLVSLGWIDIQGTISNPQIRITEIGLAALTSPS